MYTLLSLYVHICPFSPIFPSNLPFLLGCKHLKVAGMPTPPIVSWSHGNQTFTPISSPRPLLSRSQMTSILWNLLDSYFTSSTSKQRRLRKSGLRSKRKTGKYGILEAKRNCFKEKSLINSFLVSLAGLFFSSSPGSLRIGVPQGPILCPFLHLYSLSWWLNPPWRH